MHPTNNYQLIVSNLILQHQGIFKKWLHTTDISNCPNSNILQLTFINMVRIAPVAIVDSSGLKIRAVRLRITDCSAPPNNTDSKF